MAEVATCPRCEGDKRIYNARSGRAEPCPTCDAKGFVRVDEPSESAAVQSAGDPLDLTYER